MRTSRVAAVIASGVLPAGLAVANPVASTAVQAGGHGQAAPRNGLIVFESNVTGLNQLYTVRPDGSRLRQITHVVDAAVGGADWSPDGRRLIFTIDPDSDEGGVIAIANADGSGLRTLPRLTPPGGSV